MSDGNFNRSLLPHTPYHSGLQTGKSMARMKAIEAFKCYLEETHAHLNEEEQKTETVENNKETEKIMPYSQNDICVMCGDYCPEGRHVCERCERENK